MMVNSTTIGMLVVLLLATFVRATFGFGEALIGVPLLALLIPIRVAVPLVVLISITVSTIVLIQDWRHVHVRSAGWLIGSTLIGMPLGVFLLARVESGVIKACLGVVLLGFSLYSLLYRKRGVLTDDRLAWPFGLTAGMLGGAYGMNGPPLVMYGTLRGWSPLHFRATLQGYFLPASLIAMMGYWLAGLWRHDVTRDYWMALPGVIVATFLGQALSGRMEARSFLRYVNVVLLFVAATLLVQSLLCGR